MAADQPSGKDAETRPSRLGRLRPRSRRQFWILLAGLLALNFAIAAATDDDPPTPPEVTYSSFLTEVEEGNVRRVTAQGEMIVGTFKRPVDPPGRAVGPTRRFLTVRPDFANTGQLLKSLRENDVVISARSLSTERPLWQTLALGFGPTILLVALLVFLIRRFAPGSAFGAMGRSKAKRYEATDQRTTFDDVAGIDEAKEELAEIVDFLRHPDRYSRLGGQIPRGVLLSGPPGTGKTLLARAVAGEAEVPFFSLSASEFVEMVVGVGASRVRDLFTEAKEAAPAIIFIDELDAIGRSRSAGGNLAGNDEREQTLNQILTEMDGFSGSEGIIVLAATNRPEILDRALLRPGRFDRQVVVNAPDQAGRRRILDVHTRSVPLADDVDLDAIASMTPGMVGADLRNLINEAALTAARRNRLQVGVDDFMAAFERVVLGAERRITIPLEERERTAYHEAGHAIIGMLEPGADPVRKVSIVPRGRSLGVTLQSPDNDRYGYRSAYLEGRIVAALGGRAAEELVYGELTTGAENDLEQATRIARMMVGRWGMSEAIGPVSVLSAHEDDPLTAGARAASEETRQLIDSEVRRIIDDCYVRALALLRRNRKALEALATTLLERETLETTDAYAAAGFDAPKPEELEEADEPTVVARTADDEDATGPLQ